jgi:tRNA dimethylallyltransferase
VLHARIGQRFDDMLDAGFLDEVRALRARGDLTVSLPSMRCVGYRQAWQFLDEVASLGAIGPGPLASRRQRFIDEAVAATRQLAKRQLTWLRSMPDRQVIDCLARDAAEQVISKVAQLSGPA